MAFLLSACSRAPVPSAPFDPTETPTPAPTSTSHPIASRHPQEFVALEPLVRTPQDLELIALASPTAIEVDGHGNETIWARTASVQTLDRSSQRPIELRAVYTETHIYFLVTYPDVNENRTHRSYAHDPTEGVYKPAYDREDVFVIKWSMDRPPASITLADPEPHHADIWFWKACRTDPQGYADDKMHILSTAANKASIPIGKATAGELYLERRGDRGVIGYNELIPLEYDGEIVPRYAPRPAEGSRADVRAKGAWKDGAWTLEFGRALDTTHPDDDIILQSGQTFLFGVSCYEIAGGQVEPDWSQPLYKTGDVFDRLTLRFAEKEPSL